jgi:tetratricopeptide (TPR) repeat protein
MDRLLPPPDDDQPGKHKKMAVKEPTHQEAASKDIEVGGYYLQTRNWKAAHSRFESALILDPENPDVYWGLAEAERHLGDMAAAKTNYLKLLDYDPDSPHGKEARKVLKDPALANAKVAAPVQPAAESPK